METVGGFCPRYYCTNLRNGLCSTFDLQRCNKIYFLPIASRVSPSHMTPLVKITSTDNFIIKMEKLLVIWVIMRLYYM